MSKKVTALIVITALLMTGCKSEEVKSGISISIRNEKDTEINDLKVDKNVNNAGIYRYSLTWTTDGEAYECAFTGVKEELSDDQLRDIARGSLSEDVTDLVAKGEDNLIVDAEKTTRVLPHGGEPVEPSEYQKLEKWGEKNLCWAASLSNVLTYTGWIEKAVNPETGEKFVNEDDVFQYFAAHFTDDGAEPYDALYWVFNGQFYPNGGSVLRDENTEALVNGQTFEEICKSEDEIVEGEKIASDEFISALKEIADGSGMEADIAIQLPTHPLKSDPYAELCYDSDLKKYYMEDETVVLYEDDVKDLYQYFTYLEDGTIVVVEKKNDAYVDKDGHSYDVRDVWYGPLIKEEDTFISPFRYTQQDNAYYDYAEEPFEEECVYVYTRKIGYVEEADIDMDTEVMAYCGKHAITITGYVLNTTTDTLVSLFVADSDDNADVYSIIKEADSDKKRDDIMHIYPVEQVEEYGQETYVLKNYTDITVGVINNLVLLKKAE